jgi:methionine-rich copper-binding protein CopC
MPHRLAFAFVLFLSLGQNAFAHAFLKHADPAVGSSVAALPSQLVLSFTESLEVPFCKVAVTGPHGATAGNAPQAVAGHPDEIAIPLKSAGPGSYQVVWHAVSVDTHHTQGQFSFTVTGG